MCMDWLEWTSLGVAIALAAYLVLALIWGDRL